MKLYFQKDYRGITLIELMIALVIGAVLMTGLFTAFISQHRSYTVQDQISTVQQSVRAGMSLMVREIRMAGFNPMLNPVTGWSPTNPWFGILNAGPNDITISFDNGVPGAEENGVLDPGETIRYFLADFDGDGDNDLLRQEVDARNLLAQLVIENVVNQPLFTYEILADGRETVIEGRPASVWDGVDSDGDGFVDLADPDGDMIDPNGDGDMISDPDNYPIGTLGPNGGGDLNNDGLVNDGDRQFFRDAIRNVIINLEVRTEFEDPNYPGGLNIRGTAADGTCRTRMLLARVRVRNLGLGLLPGMGFVDSGD